MINWDINYEDGLVDVDKNRNIVEKNFLDNIIKTSFNILGVKDASISVAMVSDEKIMMANKEYRKKDKTTDVLSFVYEKDPLDGEVLICYNKILEQSMEKGHSFDEELKILLVHSLTHLSGYDHEDNDDAVKMKKIEKEILDKL